MTLTPGHLNEEQRKVLRQVALTYRRARRVGKHQNEAVDAAIAEYRRLSPFATGPLPSPSTPVTREWGEGFPRALGVVGATRTWLYGSAKGLTPLVKDPTFGL
jgi:hypothetical protein